MRQLASPTTPETHISDFRYQKRSDSRAEKDDFFSEFDGSHEPSDTPSSSTTSRIKTRRELYTDLIGTVLRNFRQGINSAVNLGQLRLQNLNELRQRRLYDFQDTSSNSDSDNSNIHKKEMTVKVPNKLLIGRNDYVEDNNNKRRMLQRLSEATTSSTINSNNNIITSSTPVILPSEIELIDSTKENQNNGTTTVNEENSFGLKLNGDEMDNNDGYNYYGPNNNNKFGTSPDDDDDNIGGVGSSIGDDDNLGVGTDDNNSNNINKDIIVSSILTALGILPPQGGTIGANTNNKTNPDAGATLRNIRNFIIQRKVKKLAKFVITPFLESLSRAQLNATQDNKDKVNATPDDYDRDFEESVSNPELSAFTSSSSARNLDSYGIMVLEFFGTIFGLTWGLVSQIQGMVMPEE